MGAPERHPIPWQEESFYDKAALDAETRRIFDICHGCRRCFNLCSSFPRLFDLIDDSETGELDSVSSEGFPSIIDACTLCDMCFMTKCPYVPPHEFNLDFPHLMLRHRAVLAREGKAPSFIAGELAKIDRNGRLFAPIAFLVNFFTARRLYPVRKMMEWVASIDARVVLPRFSSKPFTKWARGAMKRGVFVRKKRAKMKRKALIYTSCITEYNAPDMGKAALSLLSHLGVEVELAYPECCGMPILEQGRLSEVAEKAEKISAVLSEKIRQGFEVITLTASCGLMLKQEWALLLPKDKNVALLAEATKDITEYVVDIAHKEGLPEGMRPIAGGVGVHLACHARAQNMGPKALELVKLLPNTEASVVERCSGHGGTFGVLKPTHELAVKNGKPAARMVEKTKAGTLVSECPLAAKHLGQLVEDDSKKKLAIAHPVELMAKSYGLLEEKNG